MNVKLPCALFEVRTVLVRDQPEQDFLFDSRVLFKGTMSIKVCLINILITESNQRLKANMHL